MYEDMVFLSMDILKSLLRPFEFSKVTFIMFMVGEKGLEPSQFALLVPKTNASTNSATRPIIIAVLYIIELICPIRIIV